MQESPTFLLTLLFSSWGVITVVLTLLLIYRAILSSREDDQIFIDVAELHHYQEQQEIIAKMSRLKKPIVALSILSGVLLLTSVGVWLYQGLKTL